MGGKDKIKTELVICGNVVRHAVSFREEEMACSEQESVEPQRQSKKYEEINKNKHIKNIQTKQDKLTVVSATGERSTKHEGA